MITRSGLCCLAASTPSWPFTAVITSYPTFLRRKVTILRISSSSSTNKIFLAISSPCPALPAGRHRRGLTPHQRQGKIKCRALPVLGSCSDSPSMVRNDLLHDRQAQTCSAGFPLALIRDLAEALEQL